MRKMKKEMFLRQFPEELEYEASKLYNYFEISKEYGIVSYTKEFYTPNFWKKLTKKIEGINIVNFGVFPDSDRRQIAFVPEEYFSQDYNDKNEKSSMLKFLDFPCVFLKIHISSKFKEYTHKDFLGSLIGLNIKRELMGDLILENGVGYIPISEKIKNIIFNELSKIGNSPCKIEEINIIEEEIPSYKYDDKIIRVSSRRLDNLVSAMTNLSRNKVLEPIEKGKVLVDYFEEKNKSKNIEIGSLITIRGYGKFKLFSIRGETKKGKEILIIKKYI